MKKNPVHTLVYTLLTALLLMSCKDNDVVTSITLVGEPNHVVNAAGGELKIDFHSPKNWSATSNEVWCVVSPLTGTDGDVFITALVSENLTSSLRKATITITCAGCSKTLSISQESHVDAGFVRISHDAAQFRAPLLAGDAPTGIIHWGDGKHDDYDEELIHTYTEADEHQLTLITWGVQKIKLNSLQGVSEIDFTDF